MKTSLFLILFAAGTAAQVDRPAITNRPHGDVAARRTFSAAPAGVSRLGPEDKITISALDAEEISREWRISSTGELNLPLAGRIQAAGMTVAELEKEITERLKKYIVEPQVTVFVSEYRSQPVTVTGAVEKPGVLQLQGNRSLLDVIMMAGGPKNAGATVTLTRRMVMGGIPHASARESKGGYSLAELELKNVMNAASQEAALAVQPGDVVTVAEYRQQKLVHVVGEVVKPGAVELVSQPTVSLTKVIAVAGGLTRTAAPKKALIRHINEDGYEGESAVVDLKKVLTGRVKDLELSPGDIVIVPSSQLQTYIQAASLSAVSTGMYILARF